MDSRRCFPIATAPPTILVKNGIIRIDIGELAIMFTDIRALDQEFEKSAGNPRRGIVPSLNPLFDIPRVITISDIAPALLLFAEM